MTIAERVVSGTNIGSVLSRGAVLVPLSLMAGQTNFAMGKNSTDIGFALSSAQDHKAFAPRGASALGSQPSVVLAESHQSSEDEHSRTAMAATTFYRDLPSEAKSITLKELVTLAFAMKMPKPVVDTVDGVTTFDISAPGALVSVMIDQDTVLVSVFGENKEIQAKYILDGDRNLSADLVDELWLHFRKLSKLRASV